MDPGACDVSVRHRCVIDIVSEVTGDTSDVTVSGDLTMCVVISGDGDVRCFGTEVSCKSCNVLVSDDIHISDVQIAYLPSVGVSEQSDVIAGSISAVDVLDDVSVTFEVP